MLAPFMIIMLCGFNEPVDTSITPLLTAARKVGSKISATLMADTAKGIKQKVSLQRRHNRPRRKPG
ncbi:hypothetical protein [Mucilaginibacter antarcticus]|uniref:hypothetical protein n=1 Tax=Mucilaginibacter antarcticus TaxID=1855725 RepID=UPI003640EB02